MTTEDVLPVVGYASRDGRIWRKRSSIFTPDALVRRRDALAALALVQAERDAMQQERDELRAALESISIMETAAAMKLRARAALTPKATQQETRA